MKFSLYLHSFLPHELATIATAAERSGFHGVVTGDHPVHPVAVEPRYPYGEGRYSESSVAAETPSLDPLLCGSLVAGATQRLHYMTGVYLPLLRHPLITAKQVSVLSGFLGGRLTFGVGIGWMREEFDCLGEQWDARGARFDEVLEICRAVWAGGHVGHCGRFYDFPAVGTVPTPPVPVPLHFGGHSDAMMRRAATLGDGWICSPKIDMLRTQVTSVRRLREDAGTADRPFEFSAMCLDLASLEVFAELGVEHAILLPPWRPVRPTHPPVPGEKEDLIAALIDQARARC